MKLDLTGNVKAAVNLGIDAFAEYEKELFSKRLLTAGLPGFSIPKVIVVGPMLTLDVDSVSK